MVVMLLDGHDEMCEHPWSPGTFWKKIKKRKVRFRIVRFVTVCDTCENGRLARAGLAKVLRELNKHPSAKKEEELWAQKAEFEKIKEVRTCSVLWLLQLSRFV